MPDQEPPALDPDDLALIRHLFAKATALMENAHEIAVQGMGPKLSRKEAVRAAHKLVVATSQAQGVAEAIEIICKPGEVLKNINAKD